MRNQQIKPDYRNDINFDAADFLDSSPESYFQFDINGNIKYCNAAAFTAFGYKQDDVNRGLRVFDLALPDERHKIAAVFEDVVNGSAVRQTEFTAFQKQGTMFPAKISAFPTIKGGKVVGIGAIVLNISLRTQNKHHYLLRLRQLEVLRRIAKLRMLDDKYLAGRLQQTVEMIPAAFQYPDIACARLLTEAGEYRTGNFRVTEWGISSAIGDGFGGINGSVEVYYLEHRPEADLGPFLQDEQYVLDDIAERLQIILRRYYAREKIASLQSAVDNATDGIAIADSGRQIRYANKAMAQMLGYKLDEMTGMFVKDLFYLDSPQDIERLKENRRIVEEEGFIERGARLRRKDNSPHPVYLTNTRVEIEGSDERYLITVVKDMSRLKKFEEEIEQSRQTMERVFECATESITATDLDGFITEVNQSAVFMHGYEDRQQLIGMHAMDLVAAEDRKKAATNMQLAANYGSVKNVEYTLLKKDGTRFPAELSAAVLKDATGEPIGFVATTRDISMQKHYRRAMQDTIHMVIKAQEEERKRIARELHDDTIQSLMALLLNLDRITKTCEYAPAHAYCEIEGMRENLNLVVDEVRRFTHELRPAVIDRFGLVSAIQMLVSKIEEEGLIKTSFEIVGTQRRIYADVELILFRIAQEALNNVKRHSNATECTIVIEFTKRTVKLTIKDNGCGFTVPEIAGDLAHVGKLGVVGMYERAQLIGADFSLQSADGRGTSIKVKVRN